MTPAQPGRGCGKQRGMEPSGRSGVARRAGVIGILAVLLLLAVVSATEAGGRRHYHSGSRVFIGVGPGFWWGWPYRYPYYPYYSYYPYYPYPYYPYYPPGYARPYVEEPTVYVQQAPPTGTLEPGYWYYCQSAGAYYPTAPSCPEAWVRVPPRNE